MRPFTTDCKTRLAAYLQSESWEYVYDGRSSSDMAERFHNLMTLKINELCPTKVIKQNALSSGKPYFPPVNKLSRRKNRIYLKKGNCVEWKAVKKQLKEKLKIEGQKFIDKQCTLAQARGKGWQKNVSKIFARPGDEIDLSLILPNHQEMGLSNLQSAEKINAFFSAISQEYDHLEVSDLPKRVQDKLTLHHCEHPVIQDFEVYEDLKSAKKTASTPLDLPLNILTEFLPEIVAPVAAIYREAISSHVWPQCYKKEWHLPIKKKQEPKSEDDLRTLGLTAFFSKRLEAFLIKWIWPYILPHLSRDQMGGIPGSSVVHYLTKMIHWILQKIDNVNEPTAVLTALIDFSKGFNRMSPIRLITLLSDLNIPTCALRLIISYLRNRSMVTTFNGETSSSQRLCGGGPQGSLLIVLLFCIQVDKAGEPCQLTNVVSTNTNEIIGPCQETQIETVFPCQNEAMTSKKIYIDDLTLMEAIKLKGTLVPMTPQMIGPLEFHSRCGLVLPADRSILQHQLEDIYNFTVDNMMMVNKKKTVIMPFNFTNLYDFVPTLTFPGETQALNVIYETKLLGVTIRSDLSFSSHVNDITLSATRSMWLLLRFRDMGASRQQLLNLWQMKGRSILEFASPVFFSRLTLEQSNKIEKCQRKAFAIILQVEYKNYENALRILNQEKLSDRRISAAIRFGEKCVNNPRHNDMFPVNIPLRGEARKSWKPYKEYFCRTERFYASSIPTIARLLNQKHLAGLQ